MWKVLKKVSIIIIGFFITIFTNCQRFPVTIEVPKKLRERVFEISKKYIGMDYEWGGQDFALDGSVDCSGLIINVYKEALKGSSYRLPFDDTTVEYLYNEYTKLIQNPKQGDLIFMGENSITHIAILDRIENGIVYFIDAYSKMDKVSERNYPINHYKIKSFGRLLVKY